MRGREPQGDDDSDGLDEGHAHPHLGRRQEADARRAEEGDGPGRQFNRIFFDLKKRLEIPFCFCDMF